MIGPKRLSAIRHEVQRAFAATGDDPIRWLEERMTTPGREEAVASGESEVFHSLRRILEATEGRKTAKATRRDEEVKPAGSMSANDEDEPGAV